MWPTLWFGGRYVFARPRPLCFKNTKRPARECRAGRFGFGEGPSYCCGALSTVTDFESAETAPGPTELLLELIWRVR